jgi:hypothetical protein
VGADTQPEGVVADPTQSWMTHTFKANFSQARQRMMPNYKLTQTIYKLLAPFTVETKTELTRVAAVKVQTLTQTT